MAAEPKPFDPNEQLLAAITEKDLAKAKSALEAKADVNKKYTLSYTALDLAVKEENGNIDIVKLLCPLTNPSSQTTAIFTALRNLGENGKEVIEALLDAKATSTSEMPGQSTPLEHALRCGYVNIAKMLLDRFPQSSNEICPYAARSALYVAVTASTNQYDLINLLLEKKADPNDRLGLMQYSSSERSVLGTALFLGTNSNESTAITYQKITKLLLAAQAELTQNEQATTANYFGEKTPRMLLVAAQNKILNEVENAIRSNNISDFQSLLAHYHDLIFARDNLQDIRFMNCAAAVGNEAVITLLLDAKSSFKKKYSSGLTPLDMASSKGKINLVRQLLDA